MYNIKGRGFTGIEYRASEDDINNDKKNRTSPTDYLIKNFPTYYAKSNCQIWLTNKVNKKEILDYNVKEEEKAFPTDVTKGMIEQFINNNAKDNVNLTDEEKKKVIKLIEVITGHNYLHHILSESSFQLITKWILETDSNIERVKLLLASISIKFDLQNIEKVFELLKNHPKLITGRLLDQILKSHHGLLMLLILIEEYGDLLNHEKMKSTFLSQIISSNDVYGVIRVLWKHPDLLEDPQLTTEIWEQILTSNNPVNMLKTLWQENLKNNQLPIEIWNQIPISIFNTLWQHPDLLTNKELTPELWSEILSSNYPLNTLKEQFKLESISEIDKLKFDYAKTDDITEFPHNELESL